MKRCLIHIVMVLIITIILLPLDSFASKELDEVRSLLEDRKLDEALTSVDKILKQTPQQPEALFLRGLVLF